MVIKQISTPQNLRDLGRVITGYVKLQFSRFNLEKGLFELAKALPLFLFVICAAIAIPFILAIYGVEGINQLIQATKSQDILKEALASSFKLLFTVGGLALSGTGVFAGIKQLLGNFRKLIGSPTKNLVKYLEAPDYKKQTAFIEEFHEDFAKIVKAYVKGKVFIFIDDLDRCEHPKSADLMQAINLMIADDPSVVFILGMDREKVAASLAVKYESILKYLPSETSEIDADILERRSTSKGLAYGYTFIEKFVQLPFLVPQPSQADFKKFLFKIATSNDQEGQNPTPKKSFLGDGHLARQFSNKVNQSFNKVNQSFNQITQYFNKNSRKSSTQTSESSSDSETTSQTNRDQESQALSETEASRITTIKQLEKIQVEFTQDSKTVQNVIMMVALAFDYNPRRIKQFINIFRLKVYIASTTGLFYEDQDDQGNLLSPALTFEQLGKFTAISLKWPLLLLDLENDPFLLQRLEYFVLGQYQLFAEGETRTESETVRFWAGHPKLKALIKAGYEPKNLSDFSLLSVNNNQLFGNWLLLALFLLPPIDPKFSLAAVKVEKLLQVSPRVVRPKVENKSQKEAVDQSLIYIPVDMSEYYQMKQNPYTGAILLPGDIELEMVDIPGGTFMMGSNEHDSEKPIHQVTVPTFQIGKYPVTQEQYQAVMGKNPSKFKDNPKNPVEMVSWNNAREFCQKLSQMTEKNYRLPTEAEWEYACRAGTQTRYYFGDDEEQLGEYAWYGDNSGKTLLNSLEIWQKDPGNYWKRLEENECKTHPVGQKRPNDWGLYDMSGNVWEWCADGWRGSYAEKPGYPRINGSIIWSPNNAVHVLRGSSWDDNPRYCRSAFRFKHEFSSSSYGFRVVCSPRIP